MLWDGCWGWKLPLSHIHGPSFYRSYIPFVYLPLEMWVKLQMIATLHWGKRLYRMDLYRESLYAAVMKCNPSAKWYTQKVLDIVSREVSELCFTEKETLNCVKKNWEWWSNEIQSGAAVCMALCCSSKEMVKWAQPSMAMCWVSFSNNFARLRS
jgi:hypothetical protein